MPTVGVVSLGAMGSAVADALGRGGVRVVATLEGRSERTARLAGRTASVRLLPDLTSVVREADVILSIVPPERASAAADTILRAAGAHAARPLLVELNAIAPATAVRIASAASTTGIETVDGSISGPPPWKPGTTRIYLSGPRAPEVAVLSFEGVERIVVGDVVGSASAVKMSTGSVYKGTTALLLQALLAAHANGVLEHVLADFDAAAPTLVADLERRLARAAAKSVRFVGEMHEIASTQSAAGLTPALFEAVAEVYAVLSESPLGRANPEDAPRDLTVAQMLSDAR